MPLFQSSVLSKYLKDQDEQLVNDAFDRFTAYFHNPTIQQNIRESKEEQFQEGFLTELFVKVLGYVINPNPDYNLTTEFKNQTGAKKADGAILKDGVAIGVIELKSTKTKDLDAVRQQAFDYKANQANCTYVITSNFEKLRFYINNAVDYEEFDLFRLTFERFRILHLCLSDQEILRDIPLHIKEESVLQDEQITKKLYADYSVFKRELYDDLVTRNMDDPLFEGLDEKEIKKTLFQKSQKLLDRFLFIFFAEDRGLLPPNSTTRILTQWTQLKDLDAYVPLYDRFKKYFGYLNTGFKGKEHDIYAYNGGLFKPDEILDSLLINDDMLFRHTSGLTRYNFETEVDVNILGHIFENSLNEIETVNAEIEGVAFEKQTSKRKKDGVFYTPKYITKYIVDNTVGRLCQEQKEELGIAEEDYLKSRKGRKKETLKALDDKLKTYRDWLLQITICDPACGSGAFLNQALNFLIEEHHYIDQLSSTLLDLPMVFRNVENSILENNLFGVDLNEESVDIARLSLWLRTAQKGRKLTTLSSNIKCGNSLIDDTEIAGDKAFNWQKEFSQIFTQKEKMAHHLTWVTHNSRTSQRMIDNKVKKGDAFLLDNENEVVISKAIAGIVKEDDLNVMAYNICTDHVHMLLVCEDKEVPNIVRKLKGKSSQILKEQLQIPKEEQFTLWAQKYSNTHIDNVDQLWNTVEYIKTNREKHELPTNKGLQPLVDSIGCDYDHAFRTEYKGGFDVVIGNPPYVRQELFGDIKSYLEKKYKVFDGTSDLFSYFYEKAFEVLKQDGYFGFISNTFDKTKAANKLRAFLTREIQFISYVDFTEVQIFEGATTYPIILIAQNKILLDGEFDYIKIPFERKNNVIDIVLEVSEKVQQKSLDYKNWSFNSVQEFKILNRIRTNRTIRETFSKCFYGIKTGFNEAFIIDEKMKSILEKKHFSSKKLIKPFYEGKDIQKWISPTIKKYLIFTRRGTDIDSYPAIKDYLSSYRESLTPKKSTEEKRGRKPGPYKWFEIQDSVDYYKIFETAKITWPNLQANNKFCLDSNGYYINAPSVVFPSNNKTLLSILNSKLVWYFLQSICVVRSGGYIEVKPQYFEQIPIPEIKNEVAFDDRSDKIINATAELQKLQSGFTSLLSGKFKLEKLTKKLQNWDELEFGEFIKELKKAKIQLSLSEEAEWMQYFNEQKQKAQELKSELNRIDKEIDQMVYELYGLTEEEIKIIERS